MWEVAYGQYLHTSIIPSFFFQEASFKSEFLSPDCSLQFSYILVTSFYKIFKNCFWFYGEHVNQQVWWQNALIIRARKQARNNQCYPQRGIIHTQTILPILTITILIFGKFGIWLADPLGERRGGGVEFSNGTFKIFSANSV